VIVKMEACREQAEARRKKAIHSRVVRARRQADMDLARLLVARRGPVERWAGPWVTLEGDADPAGGSWGAGSQEAKNHRESPLMPR
jgi:hypothetical protein